MVEIDIFDYEDRDVHIGEYNVPVKLIINRVSYEKAKSKLRINKNSSTIAFQNVNFKKEISIHKDDDLDYNISISFHNCFIDSFTPFALKSKNVDLSFGACVVKHFNAQNVPLKSVQFNNCFGTFFLVNLKSCQISYTEENIFIRDWYKKAPLDEILSFKTNFYITNVEKTNLYGNEIEEDRRSKLLKHHKHFYIDDNPLFKKLTLKKLLTNEEKLKLNLNISLTYNANFNHLKTTIKNLLLNAISLNGKTNGEILIEDCKIDNVFLRNFSPKEDFTLYNIETRGIEKGKFEVHNSNLDNTWFNSVKLNQYFIVFFKSSFINTKFYSTIFPTTKELLDSNSLSSIENIHYPDKKSNKSAYNRDMYELFLELKQALEKRGNIFEAQKMKAIAHSFLNKITTSKVWESEFWNSTMVLYLNRISNFHGVSLRNSFLLIIGVILFFHWLTVLSYKSYYFTFNSWEEVLEIIDNTKRYIFVLANPTHRVSSLVPNGEITGFTYMISFFSRIVIGYLYYQFIAAFRRFGK